MPNTPPPIIVDYFPNHPLELTQFQDLINGRNRCFSDLRHNNGEPEPFCPENLTIRMADFELNTQLSLLQQEADSVSCLQKYTDAAPAPSSSTCSVTNSFRRMKIGDKATTAAKKRAARRVEKDACDKKTEGDRVKLPKSISVRCNGFIKANQGGDGRMGRILDRNHFRAVGQVKTPSNTQKVYVYGTEREKPVELKVYSQGLIKTELCNKWQETGDCPYNDRCRFAHGLKELQPVLCHPLYKTEVCRMILVGNPCPYAHRCHFRHSLTDKE